MHTQYWKLFLKHLPALIILIIGATFRLWHPHTYIFGFDQVQILTNAQEITQGKLTLLGPRTGPADMFTGPLVYYITAFFLLFIDSPWALVAMSTFISICTGATLYFLGTRYSSLRTGFIFVLIWTFSALLIKFDRIAWNPNLTLLASSLVFFPSLYLIKNSLTSWRNFNLIEQVSKHLRNNKLDLFLILLGGFLGFQAHFSGFLLPLLVLVLVVFSKKIVVLPFFATGIGLFLSIVPSIIFDVRHDWLNTRGLFSFLSEKEIVGSVLYSERISHAIVISLKTLGELVPLVTSKESAIYLALLILLIVTWRMILKEGFFAECGGALIWALTVVLIFSFYRSFAPEYYFFIYLPAFFLIIERVVTTILHKSKLHETTHHVIFWAIIFLSSMHVYSNLKLVERSGGLHIGNQYALAQDIGYFAKKYDVSNIIYDISDVDSLGMRYFVNEQVEFSENGAIIHITQTNKQILSYGYYGMWLDPRQNPQKNYLFLNESKFNDLILETPKNIYLLENKYLSEIFAPHPVFEVITDETEHSGKLVLVRDFDDPHVPKKETIYNLTDITQNTLALDKNNEPISGWKQINYKNYTGLIKVYDNLLLIYISEQEDWPKFLNWANELRVNNVIPGRIN
jgi:hypothetical protein